ncbi:hypothetical protein RchiOBHm_Chr7g0230511 [Rosa chinensis]|uniref:Uncharacterized protein n=1 Tax=Rosa chinensis TaxID=74649 RepID=A0A2P6PFF1_ROSCH|nr:hypothetical protein RchiOBHm_Chr7g0230511 [Rosa chinensis]
MIKERMGFEHTTTLFVFMTEKRERISEGKKGGKNKVATYKWSILKWFVVSCDRWNQ